MTRPMTPIVAPFPAARLRRTRSSGALRAMVRETALTPGDLIWPVFVRAGHGIEEPVASMPGVMRRSVDKMADVARQAADLGIPAICIFPYSSDADRSEDCAEAWNPDNLSNRATREIKDAVPEIAVMTDVALDPYSNTGHDGFVEDGVIVNDRTVEALVRQALSQADAGSDIIGPSDMMDGRIGAMRSALESAGHQNVTILSYAAKYASGFYGPFRDAVGASGALKGDKATYQMDPANGDEAMRLIKRDLDEGADMVMVKPGMPYLDICRRAKDQFGVPTFAYQVSGEYAMIEAAAQNGWLDGDKGYFAPRAAEILANG